MGRIDWEQFKQADAASYDPVATSFDRLSERFATPVASKLVALAAPETGQRWLDVGTGSGIVARCVSSQTEDVEVVGVDLSLQMLGVARQGSALGEDRVHSVYARMDAERLAFDDASFDGVLSLYALLHFPHPEIALAEMIRVSRPGGRLVLAFGSGPERWTQEGLIDAARRLRGRLSCSLGLRLEGPAMLERLVDQHLGGPAEVEESRLATNRGDRPSTVVRLVEGAGFTVLRTDWQGFESVVDSPELFWELQAVFSSRVRKRLEAASDRAVEGLRQAFDEACRRVTARGGALIYPHAAFSIVAQRPSA